MHFHPFNMRSCILSTLSYCILWLSPRTYATASHESVVKFSIPIKQLVLTFLLIRVLLAKGACHVFSRLGENCGTGSCMGPKTFPNTGHCKVLKTMHQREKWHPSYTSLRAILYEGQSSRQVFYNDPNRLCI